MPRHVLLAPAKVNLHLRVVGKRSDGYHNIESLVVFVDLCDTVVVRPRPGPVECRVDVAGLDGPSNLAARACSALGLEAAIQIKKRIPVGAGLGGGSSDAAAVLRATGAAHRADIARALGADVPVCLFGQPSWVTGKGDIIEPVTDLPPFWLVLSAPTGCALSSAEMYAALKRPASDSGATFRPTINRSFDRLCALVSNDFENLCVQRLPVVRGLLDALRQAGAAAATITGKGPMCFGVFASAATAQAAAHSISTGFVHFVKPTL